MSEIVSKSDRKQVLDSSVVKEDGTFIKLAVVDAFVLPEDIDHKMVTVDFYYGAESEEVNADTVYRGYVVREKFSFDLPIDNETIKEELISHWNAVYSPLDSGVIGLEELSSFEF